MEFADSDFPRDSVYTAVSNSGLVGGWGGGCYGHQILLMESQILADGILESTRKTTTIYRVMDANALERYKPS